MREQGNIGGSSGATKKSSQLGSAVDRFVDAISQSVSLDSIGWRVPLRMLLTHPRPPTALLETQRRLRTLARKRTHDERFVEQIDLALEGALRAYGTQKFLDPIRFVLFAYKGAISSHPSVSMIAVRYLFETAELPPPLQLPFETVPPEGFALTIAKTQAVATVTALIQNAVLALLKEHFRGKFAFSSWSAQDLLAGMETLWLAFTYSKIGTAKSGPLSPSLLSSDWKGCGSTLWQRLDEACAIAHPADSPSPYEPKTAEFARLELTFKSPPSLYPLQTTRSETSPSSAIMHVVCRTPIPESSERCDREEVTRHRVLETPLPVATMPSRQFIEQAKSTLLAEFPWAESALDVIFDDLLGRANLGVRELTLPPTLLVGLPGTGKSRLARRIAEQFDLARLDVCLGGVSDTKIIGGTSRGWASGRPSDLASLLGRRQTASALVLLDEIDKTKDSETNGGSVSSYLLGLLEPETSSRHYDSFLKTECDFSKVSWLCTANTLSGISKPLLSRLRILVMPQPRVEHFPAVSSSVITEMEARWKLPAGTLPPVEALSIDWQRLGSARQVRVATEAAIGAWAREVTKH